MGIDDENRLGLDLIVAMTDTVAPKPNTRDTLVRAKRTLRLLSDCNATLVHACTEAELLAKNCQLIVTVGGYRLVWVGYAQQDAEKSVCPVAQFGFNQGYIDKLLISWHDTERGRGPTGTAIRLGKTQVARDILRAPQFAPWRENARVHGFASSIALPLQRAGETFGALNIYANEADAFDQEEIRLLEELAGNLAYGISAFRLQEEHTAVLHDARRRDYICRAVVEQSVEGIVIAGRDGRVVMVNPAYCQMTGYSQEELSRHQPLDAVHSNVAPLFRSLDVVHQGGVQELEVVRKDGSRFLAEIRTYPMILSSMHGDEHAILGVISDITKQKQYDLEKQFLQKQALHNARLASVGVMAAGIVHEVNNPNNAILFNSNLLANAWKDIHIILREYFRENGDFSLGGLPFSEMCHVLPLLIDGITEHATRIQDIVNNLGYVYQEFQGTMETGLNIADILKSILSILKNKINRCTNHFTLQVDDALPLIRGDRRQLEQVFSNIITNALQSLVNVEQSVSVAVGATPKRDMLLVTVRDEGVGIAEEYQQRLTEPFFSTRLAEGGSGLGLFIADRIIENHKGKLAFSSIEGEGTTVSIQLPLFQGDAEA